MNDRTPTEAKLLPCPFCGAPAALTDTMPGGAYWCHCTICECEGPASSKDAATAISAWNRRATPPALAAEPVGMQWRVLEKGQPKTSWRSADQEQERAQWESVAKRSPKTFAIEERPLYTHPFDAAAIRAEARREALKEFIALAEAEKQQCRAEGDKAKRDGEWAKQNIWLCCGDTAGMIADQARGLADKGEAE